jgi:hypothetical protein
MTRTAAYRKSEIDVFFEKLHSERPQMLKSQKLHVSVFLCSNIPQTVLVAALDTYNFRFLRLKYNSNIGNQNIFA